jgi:hypothetical protein
MSRYCVIDGITVKSHLPIEKGDEIKETQPWYKA